MGSDLRVWGRLRLEVYGRLELGNHVRFVSGYTNPVGANQPLAFYVGPGATLGIGDGCGCSNTHIVAFNRVQILAGACVGGGCRIYDTDFHQLDPEDRLAKLGPVASAPIIIGPRAFVGGHSLLLKGVTIGEAAVIGAGSVVTRDVPAFEVWAGVPARKIRELPRT